jgi:uncharacterized surface protein with fasciclin (FAS1) repeats
MLMRFLSKVLLPTLALTFSLGGALTASAGHHENKAAHKTIVDVASDAGSFETLIAALNAAELTATLEGEGPFTVFAPTDEAFAALPEGALEALLADPDQLTAVLTLHVVAGRATAADVMTIDSVTTVQGTVLAVDTADGVAIGGARVVTADVEASNGVIHVIDRVLLPKS